VKEGICIMAAMKEDRGELDLTRRVEELDKSLSIALDINDRYQRDNKEKDELIQELRMRIRDMLLISEQHRSILGAEITDRKRLEKEVSDLKVQMSEYLSVRVNSTRKSGA
jgi:hypothetical protein